MLNNAIVPKKDDLAALVKEALANTEPAEFVKTYIGNLASILNERPKTYRGYGMYWWAMKMLLIEHGHTQFGENIELGTSTLFKFDDPVFTCCAAWALYSYNVEQGLMYSSTHAAPTLENDENEYDLIDMDMEALIMDS